MVDSAKTLWRDHVTDGVPSSGVNEPEKPKIRSWGTWLESLIAAGSLGGVWKSTQALLYADLDHDAGTVANVYDDPIASNNGTYVKISASGVGSWEQKTNFLPGYQIVSVSDDGGSTANALTMTATPYVPTDDGAALIFGNIRETNTSSTVTISFDGGTTTYAVKTASGINPPIGGLIATMPFIGVISGSGTELRLLSDISSAAIQAAAELARDQAVAAAAGVNLPSITAPDALKFLRAKADLTGYELFDVNAGGIFQYSTLADMEAATVPAESFVIEIMERTSGAGSRSGGVWARYSSEPDVPASAKTQDASGAWFALKPDGGLIRPEQLGAIAKPVIEAETRTWFDAMTTKPKREHLRLMDLLMLRLKIAGLIGSGAPIGALWSLCNQDKTESLMNILDPGTGDFSETTTMGFTPGQGFETSSGGLSTGSYSLSDLSNYALNDAHLGVFVRRGNPADNSAIFGSVDSPNDAYIVALRDDDRFGGRINSDTTQYQDIVGDLIGHIMLCRGSSSAFEMYQDGQDFASVSETSTGVPTTDIRIGAVGTQAAGIISFAHAGSNMDAYQARMCWWILNEYQNDIEGVLAQGETITAAMLDASVDLSVNTAAIQAAHALAELVGATVEYGPECYLVNDTIRIGENGSVRGIKGKTHIRADAAMTNDKAVMIAGEVGKITSGIDVRDILVDYNSARWAETTGGAGDDSDGSAFVCINTQGSSFNDIETRSGSKHGFDAFSESYNRTGVSGEYNPVEHLKTKHCHFEGIRGFGCGDDQVTFHGVKDFTFDRLHGEFGRATFSTGNSNGVEIDDYCYGFYGGAISVRFCHNFEIKGHSDALSAQRGQIQSIHMEHSARLLIRHIDHHPEDTGTPSGVVPITDMDLQIGSVLIEDPVTVTTGTGVDAKPMLIYAVKGIQFGRIFVRAGKGVRQVNGSGTEVIQAIWGAENIQYGDIQMHGFSLANDGVSIGSSAAGSHIINSIIATDTATDKAVFLGDGPQCIVGNYDISGSGTTGIFGYTGKSEVGQGFVSGFSTGTDLSN